MKIERHATARPVQLDKRTYLPFTVTADCPKCGVASVRDLMQRYLSYPVLGSPCSVYHECEACGQEWSSMVVVNLTLEAASSAEEEDRSCSSCSGSGRYDVEGGPPCGACDGTGLAPATA